MKLRVNAPVEQATPLLERFAHLDNQRALAEVSRTEGIATVNGVADAIVLPIIEEQAQIRAQLEPWWQRMGSSLLTGKRKSIELGGCIIGSKAGSTAVTFALGNDELAAKTLDENRWSKQYVRIKLALEKAAIKAALGGKHGDKLRALGFSMSTPEETFILDRVSQEGTVGR